MGFRMTCDWGATHSTSIMAGLDVEMPKANYMNPEAINAGKLPPPYDRKGLAGAIIEPIYVDESGGNAKQVAEYRNLVQKREVDVVVGYISSGTCMAIAPVVEELKKLTVFTVCGTPLIPLQRAAGE